MVPKEALLNIHLKETEKNHYAFVYLQDLAKLESRSMTSMVWLLVFEALVARQKAMEA